MGLLYVGLIAVVIWVTRLAGRLNVLELHLKEIEKNSRAGLADASAIRALGVRVARLEAGTQGPGPVPPTPS
jgi:hypothetical protein